MSVLCVVAERRSVVRVCGVKSECVRGLFMVCAGVLGFVLRVASARCMCFLGAWAL